MSDMKKEIEIMAENLKNLKKVEYLEEFCAAMENARIWIKTKDGEKLPGRNYLVNLLNIRLSEAFMGYGTGHVREFEFPDWLAVNELMIDGFIAAAKVRIEKILKQE